MSAGTLICFHCGTKNNFVDRVSLRDECDKCSADLHACKNCRFYDAGAYNECRESSADVVRDKDRANHCDYFLPGDSKFEKTKKDQLVAAAEALFKKN